MSGQTTRSWRRTSAPEGVWQSPRAPPSLPDTGDGVQLLFCVLVPTSLLSLCEIRSDDGGTKFRTF